MSGEESIASFLPLEDLIGGTSEAVPGLDVLGPTGLPRHAQRRPGGSRRTVDEDLLQALERELSRRRFGARRPGRRSDEPMDRTSWSCWSA